ncbi:MAG TPA: ABC transporter [Elusimicrobia bacterium]|jgi:iron complex transport system ATP-binding protein|nr:ABC transporter [Elusimicrobiota bacterium]
MANLLEVKNLTSGYTEKEVIKNLSFSLEKGEFLGIIGPNGAGKTTLLRVITQILPSWEGKIFYSGKDIKEFPLKDLAKEVSFLPQSIEIPFSFTVEEFISMGRFPHLNRFEKMEEYDYEVVRKVMILTDVLELSSKNVNDLSGGERQRVYLGQTLVQEPKLLLLDEPIAHLDIGHQIKILDLIKKLNQEEGLTVIAIFHDLNLASEYCDNLILLNNGEIHKIGPPNEVLTYRNIEEVYQTIVIVKENPLSSKPHILLIPQWSSK